jgi:hypothetical protein
MNARSNPTRLFGLWRRRALDPVSEPADVGTAFGMELSLMPEDEQPAARDTAKNPESGWLRRLARWRGN